MSKTRKYRPLTKDFVGKEASSPAKRVRGATKCFCGRVGYRVPEKDKETLWACVCSRGHVYYVV